MKWIDLHIKCNNETRETEEMREMGIDTPHQYDYRPVKLKIDAICGIYPNTEDGCFVFIVNGDELSVRESFDEVWDKIKP